MMASGYTGVRPTDFIRCWKDGNVIPEIRNLVTQATFCFLEGQRLILELIPSSSAIARTLNSRFYLYALNTFTGESSIIPEDYFMPHNVFKRSAEYPPLTNLPIFKEYAGDIAAKIGRMHMNGGIESWASITLICNSDEHFVLKLYAKPLIDYIAEEKGWKVDIIPRKIIRLNKRKVEFAKLINASKNYDYNLDQGRIDIGGLASEIFVHDPDTCAACGANDKQLKYCQSCKSVWYCSRDCQKAHWKPTHKAECEIIGKAFATGLSNANISRILAW